MSSEWPTVTIDQVCDLIVDCVNKTAPVVDGPTPYRMIRTTNIRNGRIDRNECRYVDEATYAKWTRRADLRFGDVLLTREAPIGEIGFVLEPKGFFLGQRVMQYRANAAKLSPRFLLYSFLSPALQHQFGSHEGSGSVVSHIRVGDCFKFKLRLPPLPVQDEIASLLGALDDRIALLRETNATLEAIAHALFKSWFLDFDPVRAKQQGLAPAGMDEATAALFPDGFEESALGMVPTGWRVGTLGDVSLNPRLGAKPESIPPETPYFGLEHMPRRSIALASAGTAEGLESGKFWFERDDVLFGKLRPYFHKVGLAPTRGVCSTDILVVRPNSPSLLGFVAMHASSDALIAHTTMLSNGARMPRTSWQDIAGFKVVLPPEEVAAAFNGVAYALFERIYANIDVARALSETRDALLPRLISGQLRLPETHALVEEVA